MKVGRGKEIEELAALIVKSGFVKTTKKPQKLSLAVIIIITCTKKIIKLINKNNGQHFHGNRGN